MKILYAQSLSENDLPEDYGIKNCYLREINLKNDDAKIQLKEHYHKEYEIHIAICGTQHYKVDNEKYEIKENEFIIIPPSVSHRIVSTTENMTRYSIFFSTDKSVLNSIYCGSISESIADDLQFISKEYDKNLLFSQKMIENRVFEMIMLILRIAGCKEKQIIPKVHQKDSLIEFAKRFIKENIKQNLSVADVAAYSHISTRQFARRFFDAEGVTPSKYINDEKMKAISDYIQNTNLPLCQISEIFSYSNEFYFSSAFKKYFGSSPSVYRKMF